MGQTQKANNRDNAPVIKDEAAGLLSYEPESAQIIQLESGIEDGTFSLYCLNAATTPLSLCTARLQCAGQQLAAHAGRKGYQRLLYH